MNRAYWPPRLLPAVAVALAAWSLLPLAILWDHVAPGYFLGAWQTWGWGSVVAALVVALLLAVTGGRVVRLLPALWRRVMALPAPVFVAGAGLLLAALSVAFTLLVFSGNPRNVDGFAQLFQARMFLAGRLWLTPPDELANFATLQMILGPDKWYAQYPGGQPLVLATGLAAGAWWLLNPLFALALALATWRAARWCCDESTARLAMLLLCVSPFVVAVAGSEMSHLPAATLGMGAAALAIMATERRTALHAALSGLLLGLMTSFRPLDSVAAAIPVGAILLFWGRRRGLAIGTLVLAGILGTIPTIWYNAMTNGSWHLFGYTVLWGAQHSLGFHAVPFGQELTLARAVARSGMDLHQLNAYLLDSTVPTLAVVALGFVLGRRMLTSRDAVPFAGAGGLVALLFFYWHRDVFYGPRFLYSAVCWFIILLARSLVLLRRSTPAAAVSATPAPIRPPIDRGLVATFAVLVALATGLVAITPGRIQAYRRGTPLFNYHPDRDALKAGIHHAVVVIPDGWGSRLIARMWQAHVPVSRSTRLYAAIDACALDQALAAADTAPRERSRSLLFVLDSLAAWHEPGVPAGVTADANLRLRTDRPLAEACRQEIEVDRRGFLSYAPYLWLNNATLDGDIVWARDLGPGNAALLRRYAGRSFYRYAPGTPDGPPIFIPMDGPGW